MAGGEVTDRPSPVRGRGEGVRKCAISHSYPPRHMDFRSWWRRWQPAGEIAPKTGCWVASPVALVDHSPLTPNSADGWRGGDRSPLSRAGERGGGEGVCRASQLSLMAQGSS